MIKRLLIALLFAAPCLGSGPRFEHKDTYVNQEFRNVYQDLSFPVISTGIANVFNVTTGSTTNQTTGTLTVGTLTLAGSASGTFGKLIQSSFTSITANTNTNGTNYVLVSGSSITITPSATADRVYISGTLQFLISSDVANSAVADVAIERGGTVISSDIRSCGLASGVTGDTFYCTLPIVYLDSPNTTSAVTYGIYFRRNSTFGTGTIYINDGGGNSSLGAMDIQL